MMPSAKAMLGRSYARSTIALAMLGLVGCSGEGVAGPELPVGWGRATLVGSFSQSECVDSAYAGVPETFEAQPLSDGLEVRYHDAHFRCAQRTQAFANIQAASIDVLVQPLDMQPASVAHCDCLYEIELQLPVAPGSYDFSLYRRWDHKSGADQPLQIGDVVPVEIR